MNEARRARTQTANFQAPWLAARPRSQTRGHRRGRSSIAPSRICGTGTVSRPPNRAPPITSRQERRPCLSLWREAEAKQLLTRNVGQYDASRGPWPELGSSLRGGHAGPPPYDSRKSSYADTRRHVGAFGPPAINRNHIFMRPSELRPLTGRPWRASELRPLMKFAREVWNPAEMRDVFFLQPAENPRSDLGGRGANARAVDRLDHLPPR